MSENYKFSMHAEVCAVLHIFTNIKYSSNKGWFVKK